tara:strand:+ start:1047 stop:1214 length:168 start_codon:yes stop_codon:yes gene_type:complete
MNKEARFWTTILRQLLIFSTYLAMSPNLFFNTVLTRENKKKHLFYVEKVIKELLL